VLLQLKQFPLKWKTLRKFKSLLDRWGINMTETHENFTILINKFLDAFFDSKLKITSKSNINFETVGLIFYSKVLGTQTGLKIK
jgi:hypothetical protein